MFDMGTLQVDDKVIDRLGQMWIFLFTRNPNQYTLCRMEAGHYWYLQTNQWGEVREGLSSMQDIVRREL